MSLSSFLVSLAYYSQSNGRTMRVHGRKTDAPCGEETSIVSKLTKSEKIHSGIVECRLHTAQTHTAQSAFNHEIDRNTHFHLDILLQCSVSLLWTVCIAFIPVDQNHLIQHLWKQTLESTCKTSFANALDNMIHILFYLGFLVRICSGKVFGRVTFHHFFTQCGVLL